LLLASCAAVALLIGGLVQGAPVRAQEASPTPVECDAPELPPGTPTPQMEGSPAALEASPVAVSEETAEATPEPGTPADEATTEAATAGVLNIVTCLNTSNYTAAAALFTPNAVMQIAGTTNPYDAVQALEGEGLVFSDFQVGDVLTYPDSRVSVEVTYTEGQYQYTHERWWLVQDGEYWKLDGFDTLTPEPEGDTAVVGVQLGSPEDEYTIIPNATEVTQSPVLIFHVTNAGQEAHMMAVLKLPEGATIEQVMQDEALQQQTESIGSVDFVEPGGAQDLALVGVPPGDYTLICFFDAPDGKTHAEHGMVTTFSVTAPA